MQGIVKAVDEDHRQCQWTHGGKVPLFITLEVQTRQGPEIRKVGVKHIGF